ncbi:MAG: 2'-5' RNA ligase family protein [Bacteroidales bacterium]|nr:2'-5' RNA ligase family protein [Bacteroidales bacterium]
MDKNELYFIALIPHDELKNNIRVIKERIHSVYGAGHALKSPAHITLQMPFKRGRGEEGAISTVLQRFALREESFRVDLDGYGAFPPRVIYIRITDPDPVRSLHLRLKEVLLKELDFSEAEIMHEMQPHITLATRDLTRAAFTEAWSEYRDNKFTGYFEVRSICLLKHNGRNWDTMMEFPFGRI